MSNDGTAHTTGPTEQTAPEGAMPEVKTGTEAGAMPAETKAAGGATPPADVSGLESALRRERDARKAAEDELKRLRPQATDAETLAVRVTELETAKAAAERNALVLKVAAEYSIPSVLADRMHGDTEDELRADAEALKQALPAQVTPTQPTTTVGGPQGAPAGGRSPEEWLSVIRRH